MISRDDITELKQLMKNISRDDVTELRDYQQYLENEIKKLKNEQKEMYKIILRLVDTLGRRFGLEGFGNPAKDRFGGGFPW